MIGLVAGCRGNASKQRIQPNMEVMQFPVPATKHWSTVQLKKIPHIKQKPDFCGEACVAMALQGVGLVINQDDVFNVSKMNPERGMGVTTQELKVALENLGVQPGKVWYKVEAKQAGEQLNSLFDEIVTDLKDGTPSIVCTHFDESPDTTEHFRLIIGYDATKDEIIYHDPALDKGSELHMTRERFFHLWPLPYQPQSWTVIRFRLKHGELNVPKKPVGTAPADWAQHILGLKKRVSDHSTIVLEEPFVVIGNEQPSRVRERAVGVVRWTVQHLQQEYFPKKPNKILDIWLFADEESYRSESWRLFQDKPDTPYGYYSSSHNALVMNISTGGGTLVHEIVHPFMEANFPEAPSWFNEGLGSLYEQSAERKGHMVGLTNWRLAGLKRAIRHHDVPSFATLMSTSRDEFYDKDPGTNYSQSRYLLYYLQEKGLLKTYYEQFHQNHKQDPTGLNTLKKVLQTDDIPAFQTKWQRYVLRLKFPQ
jgi:hypothetical protein